MDLYVTFGQRSVPIVDTEHVFGYSDLICNYLFKIRNRVIGFICTMDLFWGLGAGICEKFCENIANKRKSTWEENFRDFSDRLLISQSNKKSIEIRIWSFGHIASIEHDKTATPRQI